MQYCNLFNIFLRAVDTIGEIAEGKKELSNHLQPQRKDIVTIQ